MGPSVAEGILDEFLPSFEALETQTEAIVQFLKDKGIATDEQLAPYREKARNASTVRWRAARLRTNRLFATAFNTADKTELKPSETFVDSDPRDVGCATRRTEQKRVEEKSEGSRGSPSKRADKSAAEAKQDVTPATENRSEKRDSATDRPRKGAA
jgi:hypothetical protein